MGDCTQDLTSQPSLSAEECTSRRVFVLSDVRIVREGLAAALTGRKNAWGVRASATLDHLLADVAAGGGDVVLLDMSMVGALEYACRITREAPRTPVVAFAAADADAMLIACVECGIVGFVPREGSVSDLIAAIDRALCGEAQLSPRLTVSLMRRLAALGRQKTSEEIASQLTRRERQILVMIGEGLSNKEIAARLIIEIATVKNHVHSILEKTQSRRRGEAAALIRRLPRPY